MRSYVFILFYGGLLTSSLAQPFVAALVWCWIAFMNPHREVWGFATGMPYAMIIFIAMVFSCLMAREPKRFEANAVTVGLIVFALLITLSSLTAIGPSTEVWRMWERTIKSIIGALLVASLLTSRERIHAMVWLMAISVGFYGVKGGIFTINTGGGFIVLGPADSMIADRNHLAVGLLVALPLMNYLRMQSKHRIVQLGLIAAMTLTLFAAIGSQSRGALVALAATAGLLWWRGRNKILGGAIMVVAIVGVLSFMPDSWVERMNTITNYEEDASAMGRVTIWKASWQLAVQYPLTGTGFRAPYYQHIVDLVAPDVRARAVHSIYFEALAEHGFPAFFVWLGLTAAGTFYAIRLPRLTRNRPDLAWAGDLGRMIPVSVVAYLSGGAFLSLSYWDYYWTMLIVAGSTHSIVVRALAESAARRAGAAESTWRRKGAQAALT
jgi:probable O-glycosylation ligase (exosortase A-associated)